MSARWWGGRWAVLTSVFLALGCASAPAGRTRVRPVAAVETERQTESLAAPTPIAPRSLAADGAHTCAIVDRTLRCWGDGDAIAREVATDVVSVAAMRLSWCALHSDGRVSCAASEDEDEPEIMEGIEGALQVVAGRYHACALLTGGRVRCWGENERRQLGDGTTRRAYLPVEVDGVEGTMRIAAGGDRTCAIRDDRSLVCWGYDQDAREGRDPTPVPDFAEVVDLAMQGSYLCAVLEEGTVRCAGFHPGPGSRALVGAERPAEICGIRDARTIAGGTAHLCVTRTSGVTCWGGRERERGEGSIDACDDLGTVRGLAGAVEIAAGDRHTCARLSSGEVRCWGEFSLGELGQGASSLRVGAEPVPGVSGATRVAAAFGTSCAQLSSGEVHCWGTLGRRVIFGPTAIPEAAGADRIWLGHRYGCVARPRGDVVCWGPTESGLGPRRPLAGVRRPRDVAVDAGRVVVLGRDGALTCFGCGDDRDMWGPIAPRPMRLARVSDAVEVTMGMNLWCVRRGDGRVRCGRFPSARADRGPVDVDGVTGITDLEHGRGRAYGILADGTVITWGLYYLPQARVTTVPGLTDVVEISASDGNTCARTRTGAVSCWGSTAADLVGAPGGSSDIPLPVVGLPRALAIAVGSMHACALVEGGEVHCFGAAFEGATAVPPVGATPVTVAGLTP